MKQLRKARKIRKIKRKVVRTKENVGSSKLEKTFETFLKSIGIETEQQFKIGFKFYDFKVKGKNILIELHGSYWHGSSELYKEEQLNAVQKKNITNDKYKLLLAKAHGFKLIYVWEHHFHKNKMKTKIELLKEIC